MLGNEAKVEGDNNIVIQNSENSTITVNLNNPEEVKKVLLDLQGAVDRIPLAIIHQLMDRNNKEAPVVGANVYLSVNILLGTIGLRKTEEIIGVSWGVSVVNTNKETRYFYEPTFKSSVPFENGQDTFVMTERHPNNPQFPKRLEYGEPFTTYYNIPNMQLFKKLIDKDPEVTVTAIVNTTLGEMFLSNAYPLKKLLDDEKFMQTGAFTGGI